MPDKQKIIAVLAAEPGLCNGSLYEQDNWNPEKHLCCTIGALLYSIGYTNEQLVNMNAELATREDDDEEALENRAVEDLRQHFGLNYYQIQDLIGENDDAWVIGMGALSPAERRDHMINFVTEDL